MLYTWNLYNVVNQLYLNKKRERNETGMRAEWGEEVCIK